MGEFDLLTLVQNIGLPTAIVVWLLWRSDKREDDTRQALVDLKIAIENMTSYLKRD